MQLQKHLFILVILLASFQICFAQEGLHGALVDEVGKTCSEDLMAHLDNYFIQLGNDPSATGYIVFYGDRSAEGRNLKLINYLTKGYPNRSHRDESRIVLVRGTNQAEVKIELWVTPAGLIPPRPTEYFVKEKITLTTRFDESRADFYKESGKLDIYNDGFLDLGCDFSPNRAVFARQLRSNSELTGYLVIYTQFGKSKKYADRIADFALRDLTKNFKIGGNRLRTIYGGHRQEPALELWFVPKGGKLPPLTPDLKPQE